MIQPLPWRYTPELSPSSPDDVLGSLGSECECEASDCCTALRWSHLWHLDGALTRWMRICFCTDRQWSMNNQRCVKTEWKCWFVFFKYGHSVSTVFTLMFKKKNKNLGKNLNLQVLLMCSTNTVYSSLAVYCSFYLASVWCIISSCFLIFLPAFYQQKHFANSEPSRRLCFTAVISFFLQQETIQYVGTETFC